MSAEMGASDWEMGRIARGNVLSGFSGLGGEMIVLFLLFGPSLLPSAFLKEILNLAEAGINRYGTVDTLRHSFATHLLERRMDLRKYSPKIGQ